MANATHVRLNCVGGWRSHAGCPFTCPSLATPQPHLVALQPAGADAQQVAAVAAIGGREQEPPRLVCAIAAASAGAELRASAVEVHRAADAPGVGLDGGGGDAQHRALDV